MMPVKRFSRTGDDHLNKPQPIRRRIRLGGGPSAVARLGRLERQHRTADDSVTLTDEAVMAKWAEIAPWIARMVVRIQDANDFVVHAGSALALDDRASHPYCVSHCARLPQCWC
jgi:hypothetical protein